MERTSKFQRELERLGKKYRSIDRDLGLLEQFLLDSPQGAENRTAVLHRGGELSIHKTRVRCQQLRGEKIRVVYAYFQDARIVLLEIYSKSEQNSHDKNRAKRYFDAHR